MREILTTDALKQVMFSSIRPTSRKVFIGLQSLVLMKPEKI